MHAVRGTGFGGSRLERSAGLDTVNQLLTRNYYTHYHSNGNDWIMECCVEQYALIALFKYCVSGNLHNGYCVARTSVGHRKSVNNIIRSRITVFGHNSIASVRILCLISILYV